MRDMFYNYEHNIERKDPPPLSPFDRKSEADGFYGAEPVFNAHGDCLGVKAKADSNFDLFFSLEGYIDGSNIYTLLSEGQFVLGVYSSKSKLIANFSGEMFDDENLVVHVDSSLLPPDLYSMKLIVVYDGETHTLFDNENSILRIS